MTPPSTYTFQPPSPAFKEAQRNLLLATLALRNCHLPEDIAVTDDREGLLLLDHHLATQLLVASDESELNQDVSASGSRIGIAVSTHLTVYAADTTIVVSRNTRNPRHKERAEPEGGILPRVVRITNKGNGEAILRSWGHEQNPTFLEQIQDTVDILSYIATLDSPSTRRTLDQMINRWILLVVFRAFRKIASRILKGGILWNYHPIEVIQEWCTAGNPSALSFLPLTVDLGNRKALQNRLAAESIPRDVEHPSKFIANAGNVRVWIKIFVEVFRKIEALLVTGERVQALSPNKCIELAKAMELFAILLKTSIISMFLTDISFMTFFNGVQSRLRRSSPGAIPLPSVNTNHSASEPSDANDHIPNPSSSNDMQEEARRTNEITRYFNTICAWYHSVGFLSAKITAVKQPVVVTVLCAARASIRVTEDNLSEFRDMVLDRVQQDGRDDARDALYKVPSLKPGTHYMPVHAESVLMGFMRATSGEAQSDRSVSLSWGAVVRETCLNRHWKVRSPIGVSKKCCWCCWQLSQYFQNQGHRFVLGSTHGIVFQWPAPSVGVPVEAVQEMLRTLLQRIAELVSQPGGARQSATAQSSPRATTMDEEERDWEDTDLQTTVLLLSSGGGGSFD
ncbi:hypothetical protein OF83DRAFT_807034 [Amylostereum chailletii]|nr:hypothetical protein OF83DRAFT_807034 [Amylostereum chailletii]